jgi:hypothetical protein
MPAKSNAILRPKRSWSEFHTASAGLLTAMNTEHYNGFVGNFCLHLVKAHMDNPRFLRLIIASILIIVLLVACTTVNPPPSLFKLTDTVRVTPIGNFTGGSFVRVGYVPGRNSIVVTFKANLSQAVNGCNNTLGQPNSEAVAYREYTADMQETGDYGIITCQTGPDIGGTFLGNDYYYAAMGHNNTGNVDGWWLARYDAVTWTNLVNLFFYPLAQGENNGDPMIVPVNGKIDISGKYYRSADEELATATHHQFFTPDLQPVSKRLLTDTPNIDLSSLLVVNGITNFITSTAFVGGDLTVMQYDPDWNYLSTKTLIQGASQPEGAAFDGTRFYVTYVDMSPCNSTFPSCAMNIRLAAFDPAWNLLEDIPVTNFALEDDKVPARPSLALWNNRIYVCYDQSESGNPYENPETADIQVYVKTYDLNQNS